MNGMLTLLYIYIYVLVIPFLVRIMTRIKYWKLVIHIYSNRILVIDLYRNIGDIAAIESAMLKLSLNMMYRNDADIVHS